MNLRPFELERYFARYEFTTKHLLASSDCETWTVDDLLALEPKAHEGLAKLRLGYIDSRGGQELRRAMRESTPASTTIRCFASRARKRRSSSSCRRLSPRGDDVVVHRPCYQALCGGGAGSLGGRGGSRGQARAEAGWAVDPGGAFASRQARDERARSCVNVPHNPTGWLMPRWRTFAEAARRSPMRDEHHACSRDEVYREPGERCRGRPAARGLRAFRVGTPCPSG